MSVPTVIFIDTSILDEQNYNFSSAGVSAFLEIAKGQKLTLLLPDPTQREIKRHMDNRSQEVIKALKEAKRRAPFLSKWKEWPANLDDSMLVYQLRKIADREWHEFIEHFNVEKLNYDGLRLEEVMSWYDQQRAPFGRGEKWKGFPDALSLESLLAYTRENGVSVAVVSKDKDFEGACGFYSELLYFRSLAALTEALLSADKRVAEVKKIIESEPSLIVSRIKEHFPLLGFHHEDDYEADIEDVEVDDVTIIDVRVVQIGGNEVTIAFEASVDYSAYVRMDDHSSASIDSSEGWYMVWEEYRGTTQDHTKISGVAKCSISEDWKAVREILRFEIKEDDVSVTELPERKYWKGEE